MSEPVVVKLAEADIENQQALLEASTAKAKAQKAIYGFLNDLFWTLEAILVLSILASIYLFLKWLF